MTSLTLSNPSTRVEIVPAEGGRVQHLVDLHSSRELLYQQPPLPGPIPREDFMTGCPGGWDEMFPNDTPWGGHPDHGRVWSTQFNVLRCDDSAAQLRARLQQPAVTVERTYTLLPPPRRGLRIETNLRADADSGPFLWASHPMLSVCPGWLVETGAEELIADAEAPGRFSAGARIAAVPPVPDPGQGWSEVLYASGTAEASVGSPDGNGRTRLTWSPDFLRHLWIVTVTGAFGLDLCLLFEPCTTRPYRLAEAIVAGEAADLGMGESREWWVEIESLDRIPEAVGEI